MIKSVLFFKFKEKTMIILLLSVVFICIYFYFCRLQDNYNSVHWSGERCISELTSVKYQLNVVTEYKNRIDKLLTDTQKSFELEKDKSKDIMESCMAMKQQMSICQSQFEDLQNECKKVREAYDVLKTLKTSR